MSSKDWHCCWAPTRSPTRTDEIRSKEQFARVPLFLFQLKLESRSGISIASQVAALDTKMTSQFKWLVGINVTMWVFPVASRTEILAAIGEKCRAVACGGSSQAPFETSIKRATVTGSAMLFCRHGSD